MSSKISSFFRSIWNGLGSIGKGYGSITLFPQPMTDWQVQEEIHRSTDDMNKAISSFLGEDDLYKVPDQELIMLAEYLNKQELYDAFEELVKNSNISCEIGDYQIPIRSRLELVRIKEYCDQIYTKSKEKTE